jgi:tellurite resistance protein
MGCFRILAGIALALSSLLIAVFGFGLGPDARIWAGLIGLVIAAAFILFGIVTVLRERRQRLRDEALGPEHMAAKRREERLAFASDCVELDAMLALANAHGGMNDAQASLIVILMRELYELEFEPDEIRDLASRAPPFDEWVATIDATSALGAKHKADVLLAARLVAQADGAMDAEESPRIAALEKALGASAKTRKEARKAADKLAARYRDHIAAQGTAPPAA